MQPARDLQAPAHAAGEGHAPVASRRSHRPTISSTWRIRAGDERGVDAVELGVQPQVLLGGEVAVERRVLEDEADVAADVVALARRRRGRRRARCPTVGVASVQSMLIVVVLPAPLGPRKPKTSPGGDLEATPRTASTSPKDLRRSSTSIAGAMAVRRAENATATECTCRM